LVDPGAEAAGVTDVQRAVEGQVAGDVDHGGRTAGRAKAEVQIAARGQRQRADRQRRGGTTTGQRCAAGQLHVTAQLPAAADFRAAGDVDVGAV